MELGDGSLVLEVFGAGFELESKWFGVLGDDRLELTGLWRRKTVDKFIYCSRRSFGGVLGEVERAFFLAGLLMPPDFCQINLSVLPNFLMRYILVGARNRL